MKKVIVAEGVFLLVSIVGAVLQTVGVSTGNWWVVEVQLTNDSVIQNSFGIWHTENCMDNSCVVERRRLSGELAWLLGVAIIESVSAALCILSIGVATGIIVRRLRGYCNETLKKLYVVVLSGAGAVIILGVLLFVKKKAGLTPRQALLTKDGFPSWSLAMSSAAGGISLVAGVAMGMTLLCKLDDDDEEDEKSEYWQNKLKELDNITTITVNNNDSKKDITRF